MMKERIAAIVLGGIMLFSVAGFALMGVGRITPNNNQGFELVINKYLANEEAASILRTGRVLIRHVYSSQCSDCMTDAVTLQIFINKFQGYIVLEDVLIEPDNTTIVDDDGYVKFEMISPTGDITDLHDVELDDENLTDLFCDITAVQPNECVLRDVVSPVRPPQPPVVNSTSDLNLPAENTGLNNSDNTSVLNASINNSSDITGNVSGPKFNPNNTGN